MAGKSEDTAALDVGIDDAADSGPGVTETEVVHYLLQHPEFLLDHVEVLRQIAPRGRWSGDDVVDLQAVLIDRSQETIDDLRSAAQSVIQTSRSNMSVQTRTHESVLALLEAESFDDVLRIVTEDWARLLDVDIVCLGFEFARAPMPALINPSARQLPLGLVRQMMGPDMNVRLFADLVDDGTLFGEGAGLAHSAALVRVDAGYELPPALLCLGAREETFAPGQGTELLVFLGNVLALTVRRWLTRD